MGLNRLIRPGDIAHESKGIFTNQSDDVTENRKGWDVAPGRGGTATVTKAMKGLGFGEGGTVKTGRVEEGMAGFLGKRSHGVTEARR